MMQVNCQRCNSKEIFDIRYFSSAEKEKTHSLITHSRLIAIKKIRDLDSISLRDAKFIATHVNTTYRECHRCQKQLDTKENTTCVRCGALNLNWKMTN